MFLSVRKIRFTVVDPPFKTEHTSSTFTRPSSTDVKTRMCGVLVYHTFLVSGTRQERFDCCIVWTFLSCHVPYPSFPVRPFLPNGPLELNTRGPSDTTGPLSRLPQGL